jgi:hypothetical protein
VGAAPAAAAAVFTGCQARHVDRRATLDLLLAFGMADAPPRDAREFARALVLAGRWHEAVEAALAIPNARTRLLTLGDVVAAWARRRVGQFDRGGLPESVRKPDAARARCVRSIGGSGDAAS